MTDLRITPDFDIRTLNLGDKYIDANGATQTIVKKSDTLVVSVSQ